MKEASNLFEEPVKKPAGLGSGKTFKVIIFELAKQRKEIAGEEEERGWVIKGTPAVHGVTEGLAKVITCPEDLVRLKAVSILVYPFASPELTPIFPKVKGLVTDFGGLLAPVATIAREHGIPAVVGTSNATESISDGDVIRVDGTNGCVRIVARAQRHAS